jgi:hypothetical protein
VPVICPTVGRTSDSIDGVIDVEAEEGIDVLDGHARLHLGARVGVALRDELDLATEQLGDDGDLVGRQQRLRAGNPVCLLVMAIGRERHRGDASDVVRIDDGVGDVGERERDGPAGHQDDTLDSRLG